MSSDSVLDDILAAAESMSVSPASPSASPGGASPLLRRFAPRKGGGMTEGSVKLFAVIDIDCSDTTYCFGVIGNGSAFCIKRKCPVKAHLTTKMSFAGLEESYIFIRRNIPGSVFTEPKLSSSKVPSDVMSNWESQNLSATDWSTEFQAVDGTNERLTSAEEIQTESDFLVESLLLRTPAKRKKESFSGEEYEGPLSDWPNPKYQRVFPQDADELEDLIEAGVQRGVLTTTTSKIETYIVGMGEAFEETTSLHHDRLVTLEDNLEVMIGVMQTLKSRVGSSLDIDERFSAPTLWGSTAFIADDLTKVSEGLTALEDGILPPLKEAVSSLSENEVINAVKREKVVAAVKVLYSRIQAMDESIQGVTADLLMVRTEQAVRFSARDGSHEEASDDVMDYIIADRNTSPTDHHKRSSSSSGSAVVSPSKSIDGASIGEREEPQVSSILAKLIDDVRILQSAKQNTSIKFGGLGISDLSECAAWISKNFSGYQYGLIMDPLVMLDRIHIENTTPGSESSILKEMDLQKKMNIRSAGETAVLNSLRFSRPRVFHTGRPTIVAGQNKSRLNVIDSHEIWSPGRDGVMDQTVQKMNVLEAAIADEISNTFALESTAHWLATKCLTATTSFLNQLFACVESIYKRLFNFSKFTTEQAWSLTTQVLDRILADLYMPKDNLIQSLLTDNNKVTCSQVLLAAFKTHDIMAVYVAHKFENHPSVSTEYVKFLATNSGSDKVTKLMEKMEAMKVEAKLIKEEAKAAAKKADVASSKFADLSKSVESILARAKVWDKK